MIPLAEANFYSFLRTLAIIILVYYLFKFFVRIFAPILVQKAFNKVKQKVEDQMNQQQANYKSNTNSSKQEASFPKEKKKVGEYIDYEEVD